MGFYVTKIAVTALLIVLISEIAKRSSLIAAVLASIPLVSVLAMIWLYVDTGDVKKISDLSTSIFWLVLPSLVLFLVLPLLLKFEIGFYLSLGMAIAATALCYWLMVITLARYGVKL